MLDWDKYIAVADRFQRKARYEDREDLNHTIILRLAQVARNNGHKPFTEAVMYRIARRTVAKYREMLGILPSSRRKRLY